MRTYITFWREPDIPIITAFGYENFTGLLTIACALMVGVDTRRIGPDEDRIILSNQTTTIDKHFELQKRCQIDGFI